RLVLKDEDPDRSGELMPPPRLLEEPRRQGEREVADHKQHGMRRITGRAVIMVPRSEGASGYGPDREHLLNADPLEVDVEHRREVSRVGPGRGGDLDCRAVQPLN